MRILSQQSSFPKNELLLIGLRAAQYDVGPVSKIIYQHIPSHHNPPEE